MAITDASTPVRVPDVPAALLAAGRAQLRQLTLESARVVLNRLDQPTGTDEPEALLGDAHAAVRSLIRELEAVDTPTPEVVALDTDLQRILNIAGLGAARQALAAGRIRPLCPGTNQFVHADQVDGGNVATCPTCRSPKPTIAVSEDGNWRAVQAHVARHDRRCLDDDGVLDECVCGLAAAMEPF